MHNFIPVLLYVYKTTHIIYHDAHFSILVSLFFKLYRLLYQFIILTVPVYILLSYLRQDNMHSLQIVKTAEA